MAFEATGRHTIDLRSDTVTRPDAAMREAIATAEVGDDVLGDDPTAAALEAFAAELLGKEAALFFPSGIMANQAAILVHAAAGSEVLVDADSHILIYEEAAAAAWAGVQLRPVGGEGGIPDFEAYRAALRPPSRYLPRISLLCLENTHNVAGGRVVPVEAIASVSDLARQRGIPVHLDGARLGNAAVAADRPMRDWADHVDTVMLSLSKGLGAPVGSILAGPASLMEEVWRIRRRLGGGMRQVGILAAAGLHALRHNFDALAADHRRARRLASGLAGLEHLVPAAPDTNIVMIDLAPQLGGSGPVAERLRRRGVLLAEFGPHRLRAVTHRDIDDAGIDGALEAFRQVVSSSP